MNQYVKGLINLRPIFFVLTTTLMIACQVEENSKDKVIDKLRIQNSSFYILCTDNLENTNEYLEEFLKLKIQNAKWVHFAWDEQSKYCPKSNHSKQLFLWRPDSLYKVFTLKGPNELYKLKEPPSSN